MMSITEQVGQQLKKIREELKKTQVEVANDLQVDRKRLWVIENGRESPRLTTLEKYARYFNCSLQVNFVKNA